MVGLPTSESRELILRTLLSKENVEEGIDYKELATMTEGYTGSDLKVGLFLCGMLSLINHWLLNVEQISMQNLCMTAAYRPVRELIQKETRKELVRNLGHMLYF